MKRIAISLLICVVGMISASAQRFYEIESVTRISETRFEVKSGAQRLLVSPGIYDKVSANKSAYLLVTYVGTEQSVITVARRDAIQYLVLAVDSIGIDANGNSKVFLSNGKTYVSPNKDWLTVQPGQHVAGAYIDGETKVITRKWHTVPRETALSSEIPISPAPTSPVVTLDEENKVIASATRSASVTSPAPVFVPVVSEDGEELATDFPASEANAAANANKKANPTPTQPAKPTVRIVRTSK